MYATIIVPIDLANPEPGKATIETARNLKKEGGRIVLVNVVEDVPTHVAAELPGGLLENMRENAQREMADIVKSTDLSADVEVRRGRPAAAILSLAEEKGADLIVIASHRPGLQDYFLGSTAGRVVRHANCSVLVVR